MFSADCARNPYMDAYAFSDDLAGVSKVVQVTLRYTRAL